ncbi:hypothetical protein B0I31_10163 [Saccharothrix carnea]|uniref:ScoMcrA-like DNA sulfur-binding domain-containing protein n=1 Tax=Saccharothrix carnea TaxID=1280637 RepID=A0A2P8IHB4_SACCR|nr:HNH endonuclease [Saccharothrix carnea]PSL57852.1 hypothetical protein B0I31_10163 [Saccharothrix carnea]
MRVVDEAGGELNADFSVEADGGRLAVVLESAGGQTADGRGARNAHYRPALEVLLSRLAERDAVLVDALVDSSRVRDLAEDERRVLQEPVWLGRGVDVSALRQRLTSGQGRIGQRPGARKAGNNSKRLRLRVEVPGYRPADAERLKRDIAWPRTRLEERFRVPDLLAVLENSAAHRQKGEVTQPLVLTWALGQLEAGHDRLFEWAEFWPPVAELLREFGRTSAVPRDLFWQLRSAEALWETHGSTEEPTTADGSARAGFTEQAAALLADPAVRAQAAEVLRVTYLAEVDHRALWRRVGLPVAEPPRALDVLRGLIGTELPTSSGQAVEVVGVGASTGLVATGGGTVEIAVDDLQAALDRLTEDGAVTAAGGGVLSAVLGTVAGAVVEDGQVVLGNDRDRRDKHFAELDGRVVAKYRKEQGELRKVLVGDAAEAPCALCGRVFPVALLVAAHIKRRAVCDDDERNDLRNVAMLACSFGCDRLFELGHVAVDDDGTVLVASTGGSLDLHLEHLKGRVTDAFHERSAGYFRWHRRTVFQGRTAGSVGGVR